MPFRSPKMYSFIFGFHRLVWWPKWTPASSNSVIAIAAKNPPSKKASRLPFAELEALARASHAVLLALLGARIARQQPLGLELLAQLAVVFDECPCDAESQGPRLSRHAAAGDRREHVELIGGLGQHERRLDLRAQRFGRKERIERFAVDGDRPRSGAEEHAGGGCLPA